MPQKSSYTCSDYREEMRLMALQKRLSEETLSSTERRNIEAEIAELEKKLQMD